MFLKIN